MALRGPDRTPPRTSGGESACRGRSGRGGQATGGCPRPPRGAPAPPGGSASAVLGGGPVLRAADVDVGQARERRRQRRLARLAIVLWVATLAVWWRVLTGGALHPPGGLPPRPPAP